MDKKQFRKTLETILDGLKTKLESSKGIAVFVNECAKRSVTNYVLGNPGTKELNLLNKNHTPSEQEDQRKDKGDKFTTNRDIIFENNASQSGRTE